MDPLARPEVDPLACPRQDPIARPLTLWNTGWEVGNGPSCEAQSREPLNVMPIVMESPVPRKRRRDEVDERGQGSLLPVAPWVESVQRHRVELRGRDLDEATASEEVSDDVGRRRHIGLTGEHNRQRRGEGVEPRDRG